MMFFALPGLLGPGPILPILARGTELRATGSRPKRKPQPEAAHGAYGQKVTSIGVGGVVVAATELVAGFFAHKLGSGKFLLL